MQKYTKIIFYLGILVVFLPKQAHAYLDPGTGSYFFQILIAGLLGSLFFIKTIFRKIKNFFKKERNKQNGETD